MSRSNPRVLSVLERAGGFASAQEVYRLMQREGESIGLTTVNLWLMTRLSMSCGVRMAKLSIVCAETHTITI
jgi:hypothetical protein